MEGGQPANCRSRFRGHRKGVLEVALGGRSGINSMSESGEATGTATTKAYAAQQSSEMHLGVCRVHFPGIGRGRGREKKYRCFGRRRQAGEMATRRRLSKVGLPRTSFSYDQTSSGGSGETCGKVKLATDWWGIDSALIHVDRRQKVLQRIPISVSRGGTTPSNHRGEEWSPATNVGALRRPV